MAPLKIFNSFSLVLVYFALIANASLFTTVSGSARQIVSGDNSLEIVASDYQGAKPEPSDEDGNSNPNYEEIFDHVLPNPGNLVFVTHQIKLSSLYLKPLSHDPPWAIRRPPRT